MLSRKFFYISAGGGKFIRFSNSDGKRWIMPLHQMRMAMNLYQPSGIKGHLVKRLLPFIYWLPFIDKILHCEIINIELSEDICTRVKRILGVNYFRFAIFEGTPSAHQKATIQIWRQGKILAYCKVSDNDEIGLLFKQENLTLTRLYAAGITQIPRSLLYEETDEFHLFIQSTTKTNRSKMVHRWSRKHWEFLALLHEKTNVKCRFEDSDLAKSMISLEYHLGNLPKADAEIIERSIDIVRSHYHDREVEFSAYHGDFTPWNMFFEKGELSVFDFEYFKEIMPPYMDMIHYVNQSAIIERKYSGMAIYKHFLKEVSCCNSPFSSLEILYLSYLLYVISFYFRIGLLNFGPSDNGYRQWLNLIKIITKRIKHDGSLFLQ